MVVIIKLVSSILSILSLARLPGGQSPCLFTRLWITLTLSTSLSKPLLHSEWQTNYPGLFIPKIGVKLSVCNFLGLYKLRNGFQ